MKTLSTFGPKSLHAAPETVPLRRGVDRRSFLRISLGVAGGCACGLCARGFGASSSSGDTPKLISPGCRRSKVKVAKLYLGVPGAHWPTPKMDFDAEVRRYEAAFDAMRNDFADMEFALNRPITSLDDLKTVRNQLNGVDGILLIHLSMGAAQIISDVLRAGKPTALFAAPYSGHEWTRLGGLRNEPGGENLECLLTSDLGQLAAAVRPFRAIHHLREAKVLNLTTHPLSTEYVQSVAKKFGTEIKVVDLPRVLDAYNSVEDGSAETEARRLTREAVAVVEPPEKEVFNSCKLALAFERIVNEEEATALTVDCYGTMYRKLPAFPCVGFVRLNDMGLAGICESDLASAMTFLLLQGLTGRPGFISDPTIDESKDAIILAHCLGSTRMDGPAGDRAPYKLRTIMERQEGCVPQVRMRVGQKVTQAILVGADRLQYFTGEIMECPDTERGCRTKITVKVDGDVEKLWQNWSHGLHRVTCYGDLTADLKRFCRYKGIELVNEA